MSRPTFLAAFADGAVLESFEEVDFASHDAPVSGLWRTPTEGEEYVASRIENEDSGANPWSGDGGFGGSIHGVSEQSGQPEG